MLFPHAIDMSDHIAFLRTTPSQLRDASFLDGREPIGTPAGSVSLASLGDLPPGPPLPAILHVSFCGSTLLTRLLDQSGQVLVYREPAVQIGLADRCAAGLPFAPQLSVADRLLSRPVDGQRTVVKPSNWANILLPEWARTKSIHPIFITMEPRAFLTAVFRGGRDRIAFTLRCADHFARGHPDRQASVAAAIGGASDPLARAARLALLSLDFQLRLFATARQAFALQADHLIDERELRAATAITAQRAAALLGLPHSAKLAGTFVAHAKDPKRSFQADTEQAANDQVEYHHGANFDAALTWAADAALAFAG